MVILTLLERFTPVLPEDTLYAFWELVMRPEWDEPVCRNLRLGILSDTQLLQAQPRASATYFYTNRRWQKVIGKPVAPIRLVDASPIIFIIQDVVLAWWHTPP